MQVADPAMGMDVLSRPYGNVIPAHAGIQGRGHGLDARVRGHDALAILGPVGFPEDITRARRTVRIRRLVRWGDYETA
jgi:hypothetical protein